MCYRNVHKHARQKNERVCREHQYECEIAAYPTSEAKAKASDADIILLGPQVRFSKGKVEEACPGVPVDAIEMKAYGKMDGKAVIEMAKKKLGD